MKILIDTCTFLWLALEPEKLSSAAAAALNDARVEVFLSEISAWEIVLEHGAGKLTLPEHPRTWIPTRRNFIQLLSLRLEAAVLFRSHDLPRVHVDPFDRLLAAQALERELTILSPDAPLTRLGARRIW